MKITKSSEALLQVAITDAIQSATINEHLVIIFKDGWGDEVLRRLDDGFREALSSILDGLSFDNFVKVQLRLLLLSQGNYEVEEECGLNELPLFKDSLSVAAKIVSIIADLPNYYIVFSPLSSDISERVANENIEIKLGDRCKIVSGAILRKSVVLEHSNEAIDGQFRRDGIQEKNTEIRDKDLYFTYRASGYINHTSFDAVLSEFNEELRSLYGLFWNQKIAKDYGFGLGSIGSYVVANKIAKSGNIFSYAGKLESDVHECHSFWTTTEFDEKNGTESFEDIIISVVNVYNSKNARKLKTAASWLLKAQLSQRSLDRAIEAAIVLEVLLGDRGTADRIGLSKLMANRCAYALGPNDDAREKIMSDFSNFYALRSEIVHTGRTTLTASERRRVHKGLEIASDMLFDEVRRISAN